MFEQYTLYAIMKDGSRYILKTDDYFLNVLLSFLKGSINHNEMKLMNTLLSVELDFLLKVVNGDCDYFLLKSQNSKIINRIDTKIFEKV